ncbi:hypothetical protein FIBSPDRAFT_1053734 [Athelia psychrophila]|uniref:Cns1/TTC4 wheel domain-containing protein n=1 Tax=Athelia psychrophila TaxID=1759441 RepID=A0A167WG08_9AGAM|nr:hypothetical protein FIBSPDRAFT_1053734 [Fibularhizoctonia sp. CBS 109695]
MFARYEEAMEEYDAAQALRGEGTNEDKPLKKDIDEGLAAPKGSKRQRKDELLRAVDARGIIVQASSRTNFPTPPSDTLRQLGPNFQPGVETLRFVTRNEETNTSNAQVAFPVFITAPYFQARPDQGSKPFRTRGPPVSESMTVGMLLDNLFSSHLVNFPDEAFVRRAMPSAVEHEHPEDRLIVMPTHRGRLLVIDPKMTFREVFSGATWPREGPLPFEDLRKVERAREHEVDGIELVQGWHLDVIVITKAHLQEFVTLMENGPRAPPS